MKIINFIKRDFRSVRGAMKDLTNGKMPTWAIVVYYILMAPIGILLYPLAKLGSWIGVKIYLRKIKKEFGA
jgi:hypothetical protein